MSARAMFRASLDIGGNRVPVKLYAAVRDRRVHFRLLHEPDRVPVKQKMVDPDSEEEVPREEMRRGLELEPGRMVVLEQEEIDALAAETERVIAVESFVAPSQIDPVWYDRPYYFGPDGDEAAYAALAEALAKTDKVGIARWSMRKKRYVGALRAEDGHLVMVKLRRAEEVVLPAEVEAPAGKDLDQKQVKLAQQLVATLEDDFDPRAYHDENRELLRELIDKKRKGERIPKKKGKPKKPSEDLAAALQKSLKKAKERRVA